MKMRQRCVQLLTIILLIVLPAVAADLSGTWAGTIKAGDGGSDKLLLILKQEGAKVTGTAGPNESERLPIEKGSIEGNHLTFELQFPNGTAAFDLQVSGNEISGTLRQQSAGQTVNTASVMLKREAGH